MQFKDYFLLMMAFGLFGNPVLAQQDSTVSQLAEILIKENRLIIPFQSVSQNINIITAAQINVTPARSVPEILALVPGVDVRQRGVSGVQANISIRGGSSEQTLMLVNGIKLNDPQTGHHIFNISVPLIAIDRVDILKGAGARIYGQNSYAGSVNIVTRIPAERIFYAELFGGDFGMNGLRLFASAPVQKLKQSFSFSRDAANGHWHNSDFNVHTYFYENELLVKKHKFKVLAGMTHRNFGANGFYSNRFLDQWEQTETWLTAISHEVKLNKWVLNNRLYRRINHDEFRLRRNEPEFFTNKHTTSATAAEVNAVYTSKLGKTGLGVELRNESIQSSNLGNHTRDFVGLFAEQHVKLNYKMDVRGGVFANHYNAYGWMFFPGVELGFQAFSHSRFYVNSGKSFRIPTFTELFYQDLSNSSNPDLKPESSLNFDLGYRFLKKNLRLEVATFNRYSNNYIDYYREKSDSSINLNKWTPRNIRTLNTRGFEISGLFLTNWVRGNFGIKQIQGGYHYIYADAESINEVETRLALTVLKQQVSASMLLQLTRFARLTVQYRFAERIRMPAYHLFDSRLNIDLPKKMVLYAEVSNISNTNYVEAGFVQMPGRWFKSGISIRVD